MTTNNASRAPIDHDYLYSTLLSVYAFIMVAGVGSMFWLASLPATTDGAKRALRILEWGYSGFFVFIVAVLWIRIYHPARRRWPTVALNIILLVFVPVGTALGIYGLRKADKALRR
jgi:cytochrome bd-type quinol oxidase subunit 2